MAREAYRRPTAARVEPPPPARRTWPGRSRAAARSWAGLRGRPPAVASPAAWPPVDVEVLTVTYGDVTAVDDLSFRAEAGEVTCVLGPNGAGQDLDDRGARGLRRPDRRAACRWSGSTRRPTTRR